MKLIQKQYNVIFSFLIDYVDYVYFLIITLHTKKP